MKTIVGAVLAVLYASQFLPLFIMPMTLAAPVVVNNVEPHSSAFLGYSETVSPVEVFRRQPDGIRFSEELTKVVEMTEHIKSKATMRVVEKRELKDFLARFAHDLDVAKPWRDYSKDGIYNAVKELGNAVLKEWKSSDVRYAVIGHSMECLAETKPTVGFADLPLDKDLKDIRDKIVFHGTLDPREWQSLMIFFKNLEETLRIASEVPLPYNKLAVDEVVMYSRSAVEKWVQPEEKRKVIESINRCLAMIWVTPAIFDDLSKSTRDMFSSSGTVTLHPSASRAPEHYAELRMSGLLDRPNDLINAFLLPGIMKLVPGDVCLQKATDWSLHLSLMDVTLEMSLMLSPDRKKAQEQIHFSQEELRDKVLKARA
ncbi:hypothetical protein H0H93_007617 [Arthromyces matolae]|nr:hypothetical protein H0H93_007617 [Arthromyces matolae]